ncbi:MAG: hypothetical protein WED00_13680 [Aquisalimonadaceae bacterium]
MPQLSQPLAVPAYPRDEPLAASQTDARLEQHLEQAGRLYRQRWAYRGAWWVEARKLRLTEAHLCTHLLALTNARCTGEDAWTTPSELFIGAVVRLLADTPDKTDQVLDGLLSARSRAEVMEALCLCGEQAAQLPLVDWYWAHAPLRASLFQLWASLDIQAPEACLIAALSDAQSPADQLAALDYLATRGAAAVTHCRSFYDDRGRFAEVHPQVASAACRAGLLCGDTRAVDAAVGSLELVGDAQRESFLRVLALSDHRHALSALRQYGERHPLESARLLALHGSRQALLCLPDMVSRCDPDDVESVGFLAMGKALPRRSRSNTGLFRRPADTGQSAGTVDADAFAATLKTQLAKASASRWLAGEPLSLAMLGWLAPRVVGQGGQLLVERLALQARKVCRITARDWMTRRERRLQTLTGKSVAGMVRSSA